MSRRKNRHAQKRAEVQQQMAGAHLLGQQQNQPSVGVIEWARQAHPFHFSIPSRGGRQVNLNIAAGETKVHRAAAVIAAELAGRVANYNESDEFEVPSQDEIADQATELAIRVVENCDQWENQQIEEEAEHNRREREERQRAAEEEAKQEQVSKGGIIEGKG